MAKILILHGPNLNLLGKREPETLIVFQSNSEAELLDQIQSAPPQQIDFIIINPAAFTHTSIALRDALLAVAIPFIEVHLSNIHAREIYRHYSYLSDIATGVITGFGINSYTLALQAAHFYLQSTKK